jgi:hypothetical protein
MPKKFTLSCFCQISVLLPLVSGYCDQGFLRDCLCDPKLPIAGTRYHYVDAPIRIDSSFDHVGNDFRAGALVKLKDCGSSFLERCETIDRSPSCCNKKVATIKNSLGKSLADAAAASCDQPHLLAHLPRLSVVA